MSIIFNVPPVIFASGRNPNTGPQRRLPTAPFQPPRSSNPSIPFMSFDIGSSPASTSFSTPQFGAIAGGIGSGSANFDYEPPLLEELGLLEASSVEHDPDFSSVQKDYSDPNAESGSNNNIFPPLFPARSTKHWLVHVEVPESRVITRAQLVDSYTEMLTKVLGNEKDAQMCIYHVSLQPDYGFGCELDDECAKELAGVPGVISVKPDKNVDSDDKDFRCYNLQKSTNAGKSSTNQPTDIKTKKLFVTGLSFYTSEKTLRAAFEGFGELVEVKIIMDKISKRSKGYAFIEYTTEEAASAALREMNGKIINGWMIVVDVAKTNPSKYSRGRSRLAS